MIRRSIVGAIAAKELREALRDRRTLFLMVFLPVLLYPALLVVASQFAAAQVEATASRASVIVVDGADAAHPAVVALREDDELDVHVADRPSAWSLRVDLSGWPAELGPEETAHARLEYALVDDGSRLALERVETVLGDWERATLASRLSAEGLAPEFANPLAVDEVNLSPPAEQGGHLLAALLPMLVLVTVLMGAYYPAIDLTAGEKERGTIQTLFTAPISAMEVVTGKYVAVVGIASLSGGANLLSLALVVGQNLILSEELSAELDLRLRLAPALGLAVTIVLIALFFSAVMMAVAVLARSFKEAQTFTMPVYLLSLIPGMVAQLPGIEFSPALGLAPAVGPILLMKQMLTDGVRADSLFIVVVATLVYTALALALAARLFGQERVLVGERGSLRVWPRRSELRPSVAPSVEVALGWYGVLFVLLFYGGGLLQSRWPIPGVVATLWLLLAAPTVGLASWARIDIREAFGLRVPRLEAWPLTIGLALGGVVAINTANEWISTHLLRPPPALAEELARFVPALDSPAGWVSALFVMAVTPAICEELVFRGFVQSALQPRLREWQVALAVGLMFGVFHLSIYRLFGTAVLGALMSLLRSRTRSLYPSVLFHFLNNAAAVVVYGIAGDEASFPTWAAIAGIGVFAASLVALLTRFQPVRSA
ncbi:MAG: CPBP family intramembrane metalloprotease [Myxococcales bacterium]|nr:CPBP family intramembrane metalloprotease [Myxococcales bacterium]MCB9521060.1 CPBP family intramembrane metalloprotease [Myxococcales bacterium]